MSDIPMANVDGFDEWDDAILDELIQAEEKAIADSQTPLLKQQPPPSTSTYSPPRHLSQRSTSASASAPPPLRPKPELNPQFPRFKEQKESLELNKQRDKAVWNLDSVKLESCVELQKARCSPRVYSGVPTSKDTGVQTEEITASPKKDDNQMSDSLRKKLLAIWGSPKQEDLGKIIVSNLRNECATDLRSMSVAASQSSLLDAKVSQLYSVLTKVHNRMMKVDALLQPLIENCSLDNVFIVQGSLHMLHVFIRHLLSLERPVGRRNNVMVEGHKRNQTSSVDPLSFGMDVYTESKCGNWNNGVANLVSRIDWISLFELIVRISMRHTEQRIRLHAVSIMNVIVMRSNAFMGREKFGRTLVFEMTMKLLAKEAGLEVRKQVVQLLYMLLNCPKILAKFCSGYKEEMDAAAVDENAGDALNFQTCCMVFQGLADCLACCGDSLEELILCRSAVHLLAFIASIGKSGFEIFANHKLPKDANFLMLMLQVLAAESDQTTVNTRQQQFNKERTLLIRETLILLNRLASNPSYSATVSCVLTNSRDIANLALDVACRLSREDQIYEKSDIGNLARVFKKRVFAYLGDSIS